MNYYTPTCAHGPPLDTTATFSYTPNGVLDGGNGNSGSGILWSTTYLVYTNWSYSHKPKAAAITVPIVNSPPTIRHIFVLKKKKNNHQIELFIFNFLELSQCNCLNVSFKMFLSTLLVTTIVCKFT